MIKIEFFYTQSRDMDRSHRQFNDYKEFWEFMKQNYNKIRIDNMIEE